MPLCKFRVHGADQPARFGWVDRATERITPVDNDLATFLSLPLAERSVLTERWRSTNTSTLQLSEVELLAPVDRQEIWAAGVTYARSRDARMEESSQQDVYERVYNAARPEIFFKSQPERCIGPGGVVAIRHDSDWNVPEPELAIVIDAAGRIAGYSVGNDVSSRSIEGENPLYLPQAKVYSDSCSLGPWIVLPDELEDPLNLEIRLDIERVGIGSPFWSDAASTRQLHRTFDELVRCLYDALEFPFGSVLLTGTCIVPPAEFTLMAGDTTTIQIEGIGSLVNTVRMIEPRAYSSG